MAFRYMPSGPVNLPGVVLDPDLHYLGEGDVVRVNPAKTEVAVLFRRRARYNGLLVTERCNSFCLMCSQPPRQIDDGYLVNDILRTIELMPRETPAFGITGGEPTLAGEGFFSIVRHARNYLPDTELHVLTNGRRFADAELAQRLAAQKHPGLRLGIPLYSDQPDRHDFVVQARGAYDETLKGLLNLGAHGVRIELRVVVHRHTFERLPKLAEFIARNLPFVEHVALMGLELTGFAKVNLDDLWIDPYHYQQQLADAVSILRKACVPVFVFNHQLCVVPESVRPFCVASISDWKNDYLPECSGCSARTECGGFFSTGVSLAKHSDFIRPLLPAPDAVAG
ncbi:MAG TPA: His-Xaa-Ser system radical SAM maturase HxsC [Gammaproteobacteria bacterium]|nr:His-Xaa-Ser system radical SAM maturase HxsC [Gammaproteobacteria bacterium]